MLEIHADALESSITTYHEFLYYYREDDQIVYGFVEGKDDPSFYRGLIENYMPGGWRVKLIRSGNRDKVLEILDEMDWSRFPKERVCFFVDRDLSEFLGGVSYSSENLYITDNYSIENDAVTFETMERVLEEVLNVTDLNPTEIEAIRRLFESNLKVFGEAMAPLMAQILLWNRAGVKVSLSNIEPKEFFIFKVGRIELKQSYNSASSRISYAASRVCAQIASISEIDNAEIEFRRKLGIEKFIRGKYILWFFIQCALEIHQSIPHLCARHKVVPKAKVGLGVKNAIVIVAPRVRCPTSLKAFLGRNYNSYIEKFSFATQPAVRSYPS